MDKSGHVPPDVNLLSREYIHSLSVIRFGGTVTVVEDAAQAEAAFQALENEEAVGFDTESRPSFTRGVAYPVSLVQVATAEVAYLFQLVKIGFPDELVRFLANPRVQKIGVGIANDISKLKQLRRFHPAGFVDLGRLAAAKGIVQVGARALVARYLGSRLIKSSQRTDWSKPLLTEKQKNYAATDAWVCLQVYPRLLADSAHYVAPAVVASPKPEK